MRETWVSTTPKEPGLDSFNSPLRKALKVRGNGFQGEKYEVVSNLYSDVIWLVACD